MNNDLDLVICRCRTRKWYEWRCKEVVWLCGDTFPICWVVLLSGLTWSGLIHWPGWQAGTRPLGSTSEPLQFCFRLSFFSQATMGTESEQYTVQVELGALLYCFPVQFSWWVFITVKIDIHETRKKLSLSLN